MTQKTLAIATLPHSRDGSSYYRIWLPFDHLKRQSLHAFYIYPEDMGQEVPDVTVLQRPAGTGGLQMLERLVGQTKLVYEVDDDMLNVESSGLPHLTDERTKESIRRCIRLCDMVTVSCEHLADIYRPYNDNIVILPNHIKAGALDLIRTRRARPTIGWAGGTTHAWDMEEIRVPMRQVLESHDVDMHFMGADHAPILGRSLLPQCRWTNWDKDVGHYYKNVDFDIAVAPVADNLFNRSKTWIRALEMAALGIPIVASNRLPYSEFVIDGKTGFLVNGDAAWRSALELLIHDEDLREKMGAYAKEQAAGWTIEEGWPRWEAAYEKAAGG
jgi:glycosyltransferase involved in cell wall biosynthesis